MKLKLQILLFLSLCLILNAQNKITKAVRTATPPTIDGLIQEEVWKQAVPFSDFIQQEPISGGIPTYVTETRILYDNDNLYISVMCFDDEPQKIIAREMKWDGFISADDNIKIIFDTFDDNRSAYWFGTNPLGAKDDALLTGFEMNSFNEDWNGVWDVECKILDNGWSAEFVFPFSTFKFYNKEIQNWGFNILRAIRRNNEEVLWTSVGQNLGLMKISSAGDLTGIENIRRGNPVYLKPYFTAGAQFSNGNKEYKHEPGLDLKYGVTETLSLDATFNTDFAQVESDRSKINLTRFPLFFPEKREFFLEGKKTFDFNLGGNNTLFYSRRIGISNGSQIPILAGAKLVGRVNNFEVGAIDMQTAGKGSEPTTNYGTARIKYDLFNSSYVGVLATNKVSEKGSSNSFGGDINFSFNNFMGDKNLVIYSALAKSNESGGSKNSWAGNFFIDFPNDFIDTYLGYRFIQDDFNPTMGFVSRRGFTQLVYNLSVSPRINSGGIKRLDFVPVESSFYYDNNGELESASLLFSPLGIVFESGDEIGFGIGRTFDRPNEDFEIFDTTKVKAGSYWYTTYGVGVETNPSRIIFGQAEVITGGFYNGTNTSFNLEGSISLSKHFTLSGDFIYNKIKMNNNSLSTSEVGTRLTYNISTRMISSIFAQWNNELNEANINYRFNWKPNIGSDVYLVLNQLLSTEGKVRSKDFAVLAKVVWMIII
ncbi:MAG: DUF5916 domain-containing protein [Melioribacteraceae bacterium]